MPNDFLTTLSIMMAKWWHFLALATPWKDALSLRSTSAGRV